MGVSMLAAKLMVKLALYTLTSVCTFSLLLSIHFLMCWQGEFTTIKSFFDWSFPSFLWPKCVMEGGEGQPCREKLDASHSKGSNG